MNPSRDCHLWTHQILRGHARISARAYFLRLNNVFPWLPEELCAMLGQRVRDPLSLLYLAPVATASDRAASSLLSRLQQKKQERWEEAVNSIDFSHSSHKAWRTINKLLAGLDAPPRKWSNFRLFSPTSSGPRPKLLDGSISLKFLLDIRLRVF